MNRGLPIDIDDKVKIKSDDTQQLKRKRIGTPRTRITEQNARLLAMMGKFPAADAEALSMVSYTQKSPFSEGGTMPSLRTTQNTLARLVRLNAVETYRSAATGRTHYGLTETGYEYVNAYGYDIGALKTLKGMSKERLNHYRLIAHVAAQLVSPRGYFAKVLDIPPLEIESLYSENQMRAAYQPIKDELQRAKKEGKPSDYGRFRDEHLKDAVTAVKEGRSEWKELIIGNPLLLTVGHVTREGNKAKAVHQPDIAVVRDPFVPRNTAKGTNLMIEVELTKKSWDEYDRTLYTLASELSRPYVYERAIYFVTGSQVSNLIKKVDEAGGYNLVRDGKLIIVPIITRDGTLMPSERRILVGGE